jgi:gamma-glutamyltranspeptidase / glutathione hydrolase
MKPIRKSGIFLAGIAFVSSAFASEPNYAREGMVAGPEANAVQVGVDILKSGGNAFDAAVAVGFALAVTYPTAGNLGGGGFMVAAMKGGDPVFLDFRESAPQSATRAMFLDRDGNAIAGLSTQSLLACGVPGTVRGLFDILQKYGSKSREEILAPAVRLAESGFPVSYSLHQSLRYEKKYLTRFASTAKVFYPGGEIPAMGSIFKQPDLAGTLMQLSQYGPSAFYEGEIANQIVRFMEKNGGILCRDDLKSYTTKFRKPIVFDYKGYSVIGPGLPSSGGVTLSQILKVLEPLPLREMGYQSTEYVKAIVEAERLAFADRNHYLGDPDFVDVPVERLLSDSYLEARRRLLPPHWAGKSQGVSPGPLESMQTTHYCVVDKERNVAAVTYTLNGAYGMGGVVEGAGFLLNNEMDDFTAKPGSANLYGLVQGDANAIEPGKRMLSSMAPTIVRKNGEFAFTIGTPGGPTIITTNLQIFLNLVEMKMNVRDAIDAKRFHHQWLPDAIQYEPFAFSPDTLLNLVGRGYSLEEVDPIGFAAGIQSVGAGLLAGYSDGRGDGLAAGY